jgi:lipoyl(octanoyl) transferase
MRPTESGWQVLVLKRNAAKGGFWQPVTGGIDPGELPPTTAIRELGEELGLTGPVELIDPGYHFSFTEGTVTLREDVYGVVVVEDWEPVLSDEHDDYAWLSLDEALERLKYDSNKASVRRVHQVVTGEPGE